MFGNPTFQDALSGAYEENEEQRLNRERIKLKFTKQKPEEEPKARDLEMEQEIRENDTSFRDD